MRGAGNANASWCPTRGSRLEQSGKQDDGGEYIKKYGGTARRQADVAEAYAVGQVITAAVKATGGFDNTKIITYLTRVSRSRAFLGR